MTIERDTVGRATENFFSNHVRSGLLVVAAQSQAATGALLTDVSGTFSVRFLY